MYHIEGIFCSNKDFIKTNVNEMPVSTYDIAKHRHIDTIVKNKQHESIYSVLYSLHEKIMLLFHCEIHGWGCFSTMKGRNEDRLKFSIPRPKEIS